MVHFYNSLLVSAAVFFHALPTFASLVEAGDIFPHPSGNPVTNVDNAVTNLLWKKSAMSGVMELGKRGAIDTLPGLLRRNVWEMMNIPEPRSAVSESSSTLQRRQNTTATMSTGYEGYDPTTWNADVLAACQKKLTGVTASGNAAGVVVCYNLPYVNMTTGVFASDLRLYRVTPSDATWAALGQNVSISLQYSGAMVQLANLDGTNMKRDVTATATTTGAAATTSTDTTATGTASASGVPMLMQSFHFVGQVNAANLNSTTSLPAVNASDAMETILTPNVALVGVNAAGQMMNTSLPFRDAYFVTGVFAKDTNTTAAPVSIAVVAAFVLPGTYIQITPVGLYLVSAYTAFFVIIVALGTFERYKFRMFYRKKIAKQAGAKLGKNGLI